MDTGLVPGKENDTTRDFRITLKHDGPPGIEAPTLPLSAMMSRRLRVSLAHLYNPAVCQLRFERTMGKRKKLPSSAEEGWLRDQEEDAKPRHFAQTGWC